MAENIVGNSCVLKRTLYLIMSVWKKLKPAFLSTRRHALDIVYEKGFNFQPSLLVESEFCVKQNGNLSKDVAAEL